MAEKFTRLLGRINDETDTHVGYVVLTVDEEKNINRATPRGINEVKAMLANGIVIANATLVEDEIRGTESDLKRLPIFSTTGTLVSIQKYTILKEIVTKGVRTGFLVMDWLGKQAPLSYNKVLEISSMPESLTNAKVVNRDGKRIVSAIKGEFETIEITELKQIMSKNLGKGDAHSKGDTSEPSLKRFRPRKYMHDLVERNIMSRIFDYRFPFSSSSMVTAINNDKLTISSINDIKGNIADKYNNLINLEVMCKSRSGNPITAGEVFSLMFDKADSTYNERYRRYIRLKREFNKLIKTRKAKQALLSQVNDIVTRKDAGAYLTSAEFRIYYAVKHNEDLEDAIGITSIKNRLDLLKVTIEEKEKFFKEFNKEDLATCDLPFFDDYIRRGKLDFILKHGQDMKCYKDKIKSKADIQKHLDALFIVTVAVWYGKSRNNMYRYSREYLDTVISEVAHDIYNSNFSKEIDQVRNNSYIQNYMNI